MNSRLIQLSVVGMCLLVNSVVAQDEMKRFKGEVGNWDAEVKMFADPTSPPEVSKGIETNVMLGDMWLIGHFKGKMMGMDFYGSSQTGFDPVKKKYVGTWVDSMSPFPMQMEGTWDEATQTMTNIGTGKDQAGKDAKFRMTVFYRKDGSRMFTMYGDMEGQEVKMMEIAYTKAKQAAKTPAVQPVR